MILRTAFTLTIIVFLTACGTPRGPAPVVFRGDEPMQPPPPRDESIPDAAPTQPIESQALDPVDQGSWLDPVKREGRSYAKDQAKDAVRGQGALPDIPVRQAANIPFNAQAAAVKNSAKVGTAGAGGALKGAAKIAKTGGKLGRKALSNGKDGASRNEEKSFSRIPEARDDVFQKPVQVISAKARPANVKVGKGDTLFGISEKYQIALKPLIAENNLKAPYALKVGQTLKLPAPLHYRVQSGDTVMAVARRFSLDFRSLALINGIAPPYTLKVNELLVLPSLVRGKDGSWKSAAASRKPVVRRPGAKKPGAKVTPPRSAIRAPAKTSTFTWPLNGQVISGFGVKPGGTRNDGINIAASAGTAVRAAGSGTVVYAGSELKSFGNLVLIRHPNGWVSAYAHNQKLLVKEGAKVTTGDTIAEVGSSGSVSTPQLHFETRRGRDPVNPVQHLPKRS